MTYGSKSESATHYITAPQSDVVVSSSAYFNNSGWILSGPAAQPFLSFLIVFLISCIVGASSDILLSVAAVKVAVSKSEQRLVKGWLNAF